MKKDLVSALLRLTKLQKAALENDDIDAFIEHMQQKQVCMDEIDKIISQSAEVLDEDDKRILSEAMQVDQQNQKEFNRQLEEAKLELRKIRELKKRDAVYSNPYDVSFEEGIFYDKK